MGYDAMPERQGVFYNEIKSSRNLFEDKNAKVFDYIGTSFEQRSGIAKLLKKFGILKNDKRKSKTLNTNEI